MRRLLVFLIIIFPHQTVLSQINLSIDARQVTPMKLSEISEQNRYVALKMDSIFSWIATDDFLFVSRFNGKDFDGKLYQFDLSGKLIRTFANKDNRKFRDFKYDLENNRLILISRDAITLWDMTGRYLKMVRLPESSGDKDGICQVFGFAQNNVWILQHMEQGSKFLCRISRINMENEQMVTILERDFPIQNMGNNVIILYKAWYSFFGGKSYISFHDNEMYEVNGVHTRSAIQYAIRNYREDPLDFIVLEKGLAGRFLHIKYGKNERKLFWYDTKEKRTWQMRESYGKGGIEDDIFHTGTCDNYRIYGDYLTFIKQGNDLPKEMNIEKDRNVIFIVKLKQ